jgi:hypothetical protein
MLMRVSILGSIAIPDSFFAHFHAHHHTAHERPMFLFSSGQMNLQTSIDFEKEKVGVQYVQSAAWYHKLAPFRVFLQNTTTHYRSTVICQQTHDVFGEG